MRTRRDFRKFPILAAWIAVGCLAFLMGCVGVQQIPGKTAAIDVKAAAQAISPVVQPQAAESPLFPWDRPFSMLPDPGAMKDQPGSALRYIKNVFDTQLKVGAPVGKKAKAKSSCRNFVFVNNIESMSVADYGIFQVYDCENKLRLEFGGKLNAFFESSSGDFALVTAAEGQFVFDLKNYAPLSLSIPEVWRAAGWWNIDGRDALFALRRKVKSSELPGSAPLAITGIAAFGTTGGLLWELDCRSCGSIDLSFGKNDAYRYFSRGNNYFTVSASGKQGWEWPASEILKSESHVVSLTMAGTLITVDGSFAARGYSFGGKRISFPTLPGPVVSVEEYQEGTAKSYAFEIENRGVVKIVESELR